MSEQDKGTVIDMMNKNVLQLVCFKLAEEQYAMNIISVHEVIRWQKITPVPQMPDFVLGVVNIRGSVVPVFDLRAKFGLPCKDFDDKTKILVVNMNNVLVSVVVDEILDNVKVPIDSVDPAPNVKLRIERECVRGLALIDDRMIIILAPDRLGESIDSAIHVEKKNDVI